MDEAAEAYNARPHQAVTVAPEDVETMPTATFRVYQDNATKFQHNKKLTEGRKRRLEEAGAFRAPTNARRSFEPQYGPAREIASIDSMVVRATDGTETLLKHALPVPRGSEAKLPRAPVSLASPATRLQPRTRGSTLISIVNKNDRAFVHMRSYCKRLPKSAWWPCLVSSRYNGMAESTTCHRSRSKGAVLHLGLMLLEAMLRTCRRLCERSMHAVNRHAASLSTWNLDFHRRLAPTTSPCKPTSDFNRYLLNERKTAWTSSLLEQGLQLRSQPC